MERREHQNPDPFKTERVGHPEKPNQPTAIMYWSGIVKLCVPVNGKKAKGCATHPPETEKRCFPGIREILSAQRRVLTCTEIPSQATLELTPEI
jgi:hypothetical protein